MSADSSAASISNIVNPPQPPTASTPSQLTNTSALGQIANLETRNSQLNSVAAELNTNNTDLLSENKALRDKLEKYTQVQRDAMKAKLDTLITEWVNNIDVNDEKIKADFLSGMDKIVKETKEDSGVWQIMCCASQAHKQSLEKINDLTERYNQLQQQVSGGGSFRDEGARIAVKRKFDDVEPSSNAPRSIWDEFEANMRGSSVATYVPDPDTLRQLRSEWKPL